VLTKDYKIQQAKTETGNKINKPNAKQISDSKYSQVQLSEIKSNKSSPIKFPSETG